MNHAILKKHKSKIEARARNISMLLLVLILAMITTIILTLVSGINDNAAMNIVRSFSIDAADKFSYYINRDLALTQKTAISRAMTSWFAEEGNALKKAAAFDELLDYASLFQGAQLYFGIHETLNEYSINNKATLDEFVPFDKLTPASPDDRWYFECINSENDYTLNIDPEKRTGIWYLWINHKVISNGKTEGAFASGLEISDMFRGIFEEFGDAALQGYVVNKNGIIQMASTSFDIDQEETPGHISDENNDPAFTAALASYENRISGFFDSHSQSEVIKLAKGGAFGYAAIKPIADTNWSVVVFYKHSSLSGIADFLPLLIVLLSALLLYVVIMDILMRRHIYTPLNRLTQSVSQADSDAVDIFGRDRDDEIGGLARTIWDMWVRLNLQSDQLSEAHERSALQSHWYKSILDATPLPISVTDMNMCWTFVNKTAEDFLNTKLEDMLGNPCSNWNVNICNTPDCGISCAKRGLKRTYFTHDGAAYQVDTEVLKNLEGEAAGFIEVVQDITKIKEMEAIALSASKAKSDFLATMSHEMRTPMNAILGIAEIQLQDGALALKTREALEKIYNSGDLLLNIINDILDLSKIEAGKLELISAEYKTASLINDTVTLNVMRIGSKPIDFTLSVDENIPSVLSGDELRIKQILNNVLSNAIKYTKEGSVKLSVSSEKTKDNVAIVFIVNDTGQGMTEEQITELFDEYSRFNTETNRTTEGTGLGMSITKNLIRMMDGEINVESELDKGSTFIIRLPQGAAGTEVLGRELAKSLEKFQINGEKQLKRAQVVFEQMPYGKILVVDDVESNLYVARGLLLPYGLTIETVTSGFDAIAKIKDGGTYDILFMDHMMPKMDGIQTTLKIRELGYAQPVVALTANAVVGQSDVFMANGFDGFISKPIDIRQLNAILKKFVRDRHPSDAAGGYQTSQAAGETTGTAAQSLIDPELAEIFVRDAKKTLAALETLCAKRGTWDDEDIRLYTINTHGIKSALSNIDETELSAAALKLEQAGRAKDTAVMAAQTPAFLGRLNALIEKLAPPEEDGDGKAAADTEEDRAYLREKMAVIKEACEVYNKKAAKAAIGDLREKSWPKATKKMLETMSEHLLNGDFEEALRSAAKMIETI